MTRDDYWRVGLALLVVGFFLFGSFDVPALIGPLGKSERLPFGVIASIVSGIAWALSTSFEATELAAGANIMAAGLAAMSTGFFVPINQIL